MAYTLVPCSCSRLRDTEGRIIRWYTLFTDIDERKQAEEALRQDERELANS